MGRIKGSTHRKTRVCLSKTDVEDLLDDLIGGMSLKEAAYIYEITISTVAKFRKKHLKVLLVRR